MVESSRLRAYLRLRLAGIGSILCRRLTDAFGDVEAVFASSPDRWRAVDGVGEKTAAAMAAVTDADIDQEIAEARRLGVQIVCIDDDAYPAGLKNIYDPPPVLYVRGRLEPADALAMAIVGSRHCTQYGLEQADRFAQLMGRAGFTVISGGARGIDAAAHRGAITSGGRTIAVMGCGLCSTYPPENKKLFDEIAAGRGAVVSELPMKTPVLAGNFPTRNRIIAGMSLGTLVVEAARRSGSLITARVAAEQGRTVYALPGRVDSPSSQGTNELIRTGAILVQNLDDILDQMGDVGAKMSPTPQAAAAGAAGAGATDAVPLGNLDVSERRLLEALAEGPVGLDDLVRRCGLDSGKTVSTMTMLVLKGLVAQQPGNMFARKNRPAM